MLAPLFKAPKADCLATLRQRQKENENIRISGLIFVFVEFVNFIIHAILLFPARFTCALPCFSRLPGHFWGSQRETEREFTIVPIKTTMEKLQYSSIRGFCTALRTDISTMTDDMCQSNGIKRPNSSLASLMCV